MKLRLELLCGGLLLAGCGVQDAVRHTSAQGTSGTTGQPPEDAGPLVCTPDAFEDFALPFLRANCETCHAHTTEFETADAVLKRNRRIQSEITSGAMPPLNVTLDAADQAKLLHWLQCQLEPVVLTDGGVIEVDAGPPYDAGPPCVVPPANGPYTGPASHDDGKNMLPGENCLACHLESTTRHKDHDEDGDDGDGDDEDDDDAPGFRVAGTVFQTATSPWTDGAASVHVILADHLGHSVDLETRSSGNFYLKAKDATGTKDLTPPFTVTVRSSAGDLQMLGDAPTGACNTCHSLQPVCDAPGRVHK